MIPRRPHGIVRRSIALSLRRGDFVAAARYTEGGQLDIVVQGILGRIARAHG